MFAFFRTTAELIGKGIYDCAIDMNHRAIDNVLDPVTNQQAATKKYVDTKTENGGRIFTVHLYGTAPALALVNEAGAMFVSVTSSIPEGPSAIYAMCKTANSTAIVRGNRIASSPGHDTGEVLIVTWDGSDGAVYLSKSGTSYDGEYALKVL